MVNPSDIEGAQSLFSQDLSLSDNSFEVSSEAEEDDTEAAA